MQNKSSMMLRLLLNRFHPGAQEKVLRAMSHETSGQVLAIGINSSELSPILQSPFQHLEHIHYSWLVPKLKDLKEGQLSLLLAFLPETMIQKLQSLLPLPSKPKPIPSAMKPFLLSKVTKEVLFEDLVPIPYLPSSELNVLAECSKEELVKLIDYLGLHDLAQEIHHIVDKKQLEKITQCLTPRRQHFLNQCLHLKEKLVTQRLNLEQWDGDCQKLGKLLHHRGMVRLGYALSGLSPDLIWHICHILDTGRGEKLNRFTSKEEIPGVTNSLRRQVNNVLKTMRQQ